MDSPDDTEALEIPSIPDHDLVRRVGRGAYGEVWLAKNLIGNFRAIKIIKRQTFEDDRPFEREFSGMQKFEPISRGHPGLVAILHVGRNPERTCFFYIMEVADDLSRGNQIEPGYYAPKTLVQMINHQGALPFPECLKIGIQLADSLDFIHRNGLIHRDIKPSNIVFINGHPKLADIGLVTDICEHATIVGSLGYMPPEGPGNPRGDIFSLGKTLYAMCMGKKPDQFPDMVNDANNSMTANELSQFNGVLRKACHSDPWQRFQSAAELGAALKAIQETTSTVTAVTDSNFAEVARHRLQIAIAYKSASQPDGQLLEWLEKKLLEAGYEVFIDRNLRIGVAWAKEIESKIRNSSAVIVLLSAASVQSEMVGYEVEIAHEQAQQHKKPVLLPVRVAYTGRLPESLGRILDPLQHFKWESPQDNERLFREVLGALECPSAISSGRPVDSIEPVGGAVPLDSKYYIVRPIDEDFAAAITRRDSIVLVKGARQMGKTSLLARGLQLARKAGDRVVLTDFQTLNLAHLESAEDLYRALMEWITLQLNLDVESDDIWNPRSSPNLNFQRFLCQFALADHAVSLVWGLDEVDRLFSCSFGSEVFGLFRSWHNARSLDPTGPWSRLTLAIAYATEAHLFIADVNQSPFNVGTRLTLEDFTFPQVADLNRRYGSPLRPQVELADFFELVGGHPYLVRRGLHEFVSRHIAFEQFAKEAGQDEGLFGDHLRRFLVLLARNEELLEVTRNLMKGKGFPDMESFYRLRTAGLIVGGSPQDARPRCKVYEVYLRKHLL